MSKHRSKARRRKHLAKWPSPTTTTRTANTPRQRPTPLGESLDPTGPPTPRCGTPPSFEVGQRLSAYLTEWSTRHPKAWRQLAHAREQHGSNGAGWPEWCWIPVAEVSKVVMANYTAPEPPDNWTIDAMLADASVLSALGRWRLGKVVMRFQDQLAAALDDTDGLDTVPTSTLYRLPAWCVYVIDELDDPTFGHIRGWFAFLDHHVATRRPYLCIHLDIEGPDGSAKWSLLPIPLDRPTITEAVTGMLDGHRLRRDLSGFDVGFEVDKVAEGCLRIVKRCLARLLYLCSEEPDLTLPTKPGATLSPADRGSSRKPWTAASQVVQWDVGYRVGADIHDMRTRCESTAGTGRKVRPHWRKAHWHKYWTGPDRSVPVLRWIMPVLVGVSNPDDLPIVERMAS